MDFWHWALKNANFHSTIIKKFNVIQADVSLKSDRKAYTYQILQFIRKNVLTSDKANLTV